MFDLNSKAFHKPQRPWSIARGKWSVALALFAVMAAAPVVAEMRPEAAARLLKELKYLSSDELEGRGIGTHGLDLAAESIRNEFADAGLDVMAVNGGAYQEFEVVAGSELQTPNELTLVGPDGDRIPLEYDEQVRTCSFGASGQFSAPIVFCGYGIVAEDEGYDDFANVDVKGKVALILRRTPQQGKEDGLFSDPHSGSSRHAALNSKLKNTIDHGAVAVLFVNDAYSSQSELAKLKEQAVTAEQRVIDAAIASIDSESVSHSPHGAANPKGDGAQHAGAAATPQSPTNPHTATTPQPTNPHAGTAPHDPHAKVSPHGDSTHVVSDTLKSAVTHLLEVRRLIENYEADPLMEFGYNGNRRGDSIPVMQVRRSAIDEQVRAATERNLSELEAEIDATGKPHSQELTGWTATGETRLKINRVPVKNVIGVLPGQGPLADETIVIGAHYDHLGRGGEGSLMPGSTDIHNGADDNASGTVALIALARRLAALPEPLPRRIVLIAFTGEERGLLGSTHYVKEPVFPLDKTIAMFNMDMVGRLTDDKLTVFGSGTAKRWDELLDQDAAQFQFDISKKPEGFGPSDHSSFYAKEIPVLHFFTGTHNDYHRPTDDWDRINFEGIGRIVDLLEDLVIKTAKSEARPEYVAVKGQADLQARSGSRPYFGSIPDFSGEASGYAIQGVSPGSPSDKAGLIGGDVIIRLGKHSITGLNDFDLALREFSPGEEVSVTVLREGKEHEFRVTLSTPR